MSKNRRKIPDSIVNQIMIKSDRMCYCGKREGEQIHHIDGDRTNNDFDNLVFACLRCHDDATVTNPLIRRPNASQVKAMRNRHYAEIEKRAQIKLEKFSESIKVVTDSNLFQTSLEALIVLEVLKIKYRYNQEDEWENREAVLSELYQFSEHSSLRVANEVVQLLDDVGHSTRY